MKIVNTYHWTINAVYETFPEATAQWEAIGGEDSRIQWFYGKESNKLIKNGVPAMIAYSAIGRKAGVNSQTIRKAFYTWRAFDEATQEEYHLAPYAVFNHARRCDNPEKVLQYYVDENAKGGCGIDEIEAVFPLDKEDDSEFEKTGLPRWAYGFIRQLAGMNKNKEKAQEHFGEFMRLWKEEQTPHLTTEQKFV